jgi:hypothetical protein
MIRLFAKVTTVSSSRVVMCPLPNVSSNSCSIGSGGRSPSTTNQGRGGFAILVVLRHASLAWLFLVAKDLAC